MASQFFLSIVEQLSLAFKPLEESLESSEKFSNLLERHGWRVESTSFDIDQIRNFFDPSNTNGSSFDKLSILIDQTIGSDLESIVDIYPQILSILQDIIKNIQSLVVLSSNPPLHLPFPFNNSEFWQEFPGELIEELLISYLEFYQPFLFSILQFLGIIERENVIVNETVTGRINYTKAILRYDNLKYITQPEELRKRVYGWGTDEFDFELLLNNLRQLINSFGNLSGLYIPSSQLLENYYATTNTVLPRLQELRIPILGGINEDNELPFDVSTHVFPIPREGDQDGMPVGIVMLLEVAGNIPFDILDKLFKLRIGGGIETIRAMKIEARPENTKVLFMNPDIDKLDIHASSSHRFIRPKILIGSENSHNIKIFDLGFGISLLGTIEDAEVKIAIKIQKAQLIIDNSDANIDSFIKDSFGNRSYTIEFGCSLVYSSKRGIHFEGNSGLETTIPVNRTIGTIKIDTLTLGIMNTDKGLDLVAGITGSIKFGPVSISIEKAGVFFMLNHVTTNEDTQQKIFGDLFLDFGFRSPSGFGITIDSNGVKGGGFISRKESEYSGVIDLNIRKISIQALAFLDTRDGSFLFAIFSNLRSPIQLGSGWKITKIGGVIGIDRTVSLGDIVSGIRSGILDSVLFPDNVIQNAPQIINDFKRVFPTKSGQHLIGPAIKIVYGTPTLLTGDIALLLEFPNPFQLSAIGRIRSKIPNEESPVIQINIAILGAIDFANLRLGIYGSLYDSKILDFALSGDMAMAASWSPEEKNLILSLGGFNPRFKPPSNFPPFNAPPLKRLTIAFSSYVSLQCYVALTSNTLQFGARVDALFKKGSATISGFLGFDALVQFVPLYFIVDVIAGFSVKYKGRSLASIKFSGFIEGPNPIRIKGSVTFSILWWDISIGVDKTFGIQIPELISSIDLWLILRDTLEQNDSWIAELPTWAIDGIIVKGSSSSEEENETNNNGHERLLVHPVGTLKVSQRIVPFNHTLTKFGTSNPLGNPQFKIISLLDESTNLVTTQDYFAPAQFSNYDNTQKLSLKSFDLMDSGVMLGDGHVDISCPLESISKKQMIYETIMIPAQPEQQIAPYFPMKIHTQIFEFSSSAYKTRLTQNQNNIQYKSKLQKPAVSITNERYIILDIDKNLVTPTEPSLHGEYSQAQAINKLQDSKIKNKNNLKIFSIFEKPSEITT